MNIDTNWKRAIDYKGSSVPLKTAQCLLKGLSLPYWAGAECKNLLYNKGYLTVTKVPVNVVSVGNLSMGGTGKTPLTLTLAKYYKKAGVSGGNSEAEVIIAAQGISVLLYPTRTETFYNASQVGR